MLNFTLSELIHSDMAVKYNINNMPDIKTCDNLLYLICDCLQPVRDLFQKPVIISSGFRTKRLNELLNGSKTSEHLTGCAADFTIRGLTVNEIVQRIRKSTIPFNQLIEEYSQNTCWVHISYKKTGNKREVLRYKNGVYTKI